MAQLKRERAERVPGPGVAPVVGLGVEPNHELVRKLADAIARRQEVELALGEAKQRVIAAESARDRAIAAVPAVPRVPSAVPRAMAAAAGASMGFSVSNWQAAFPPQLIPLPPPVPPPAAPEPPPAAPRLDDPDDGYVAPAFPLLSPSQLTGGVSQLLFENRIQFAPDRADILPGSKLLLEDIADLILSSDPVRLVVEGHTERGDARASFYLSERRAMAVLERLAKLGVPESRMLSVGYGDTRPIDENSSYEGRMRNRRVEIRILGRA